MRVHAKAPVSKLATSGGGARARILLLGVLTMGVIAATRVAHAAGNTCNGLFTIDYVSGLKFALPNDIIRVRLSLGTGSITNGTQLTIHRLRFDLDCNSNFSLGLPCTDEGSIVEYEGDGTITTTCSVTWSTGHAASATPNEVVFTASAGVDIPANQPVGFCNLEFDIKVLARSTDPTPNQIEEVTGYSAASGDAMCDNGLASSSSQSASIPLCPTCDDNNECTDNVCNQQDGTCTNPPTQASTPCTDTDGNACTTAGCDGNGVCDQNHVVKTCPPDGNPCTDDLGCNPGTGQCDFPPTQSSTPCPDTDGNACTTAGCDGNGVCDQNHIVCATTTTTTTTSTTTTTVPVCGNGVVESGEQCDPPGPNSHQCPASSPMGAFLACQPTCQCCVPTGSEAGHCSDMIDNDCNGLIDCQDPACAVCKGGTAGGQPCNTPQTTSACTNGGGKCQCPPILKDPTRIKFGPPGAGLDLLKSHGRVTIEGPVDVMGSEVGWLLSNTRGAIYSAVLPPGAFTPNPSATAFKYANPAAKTAGGVFKAKLRITHFHTSYGYFVQAYGDMSAATDALMSLQFYIGNQPTPAIHTETWQRKKDGWVALGFGS